MLDAVGRAPSRRAIRSAESRAVKQNEHFGLYPNGKPCFYCGLILRDAADEHTVYTRVAAGVIFLHPECARELGRRLATVATRADLAQDDP